MYNDTILESCKVIQGDCRDVLPKLAAESVQMCCTSPPYWGLRDYGTAQWEGGEVGCDHKQDRKLADWASSGLQRNKVSPELSAGTIALVNHQQEAHYRDVCGKCGARRIDAQLGLEATPEEYIANMVGVFREVWRVLRDDGTLWLNMGDSYGTGGSGQNFLASAGSTANSTLQDGESYGHIKRNGIKGMHKQLMGIPWRLALALQADGWYLRSDIIWHKPNPMPESVKDRCCKSHEYIFMLTKSSRYYFDSDAIAEPATSEDLLSVQSESSESLFLQEQSAVRRIERQVSRMYDDRQKDLRSEIQSNGQSESNGETLLLFGEGPNIQEGVSASLRVDGRTAREVSDSQSDAGEGTALQSSSQAILAKSKGQSDESTQGQRVSIDGEGAILQTQDRDQAQTPDQISRLHANSAGMDSDKGSIQSSVQVLRERTPALRNGSCDSTLKRRDTHSIECRSSLPELQRQQRQPLRNRRSVWTIPTQPYAEAHFATFPEEIPKLCILAGSKPGDTILDPFAGSGTVGKVALELGRRAVLIELNPTYIELARDRTFVTPGFF